MCPVYVNEHDQHETDFNREASLHFELNNETIHIYVPRGANLLRRLSPLLKKLLAEVLNNK